MNKKSQSQIIPALLIVLIVMAFFIIVWQVVRGVTSSEPIKESNETLPYYSKIETFCAYHNITSLNEGFHSYCILNINDTAYKKELIYVINENGTGRYYFEEEK